MTRNLTAFAPRMAAAVGGRRGRLLDVRLAGALADDAATHPKRRKSCILLWMNGGPSQMDTFDLKPGHANGGPFKEIETSVPGIRISEHLPKIARLMERMAIIRSMSTKEGDHGRATYYLRTGYLPQRADPVSDDRLAGRQGTGRGRRRAAQLRQHRALPRRQPGRLRSGLPRPAVRPAGRRREQVRHHFRQRTAGRSRASKVPGPGPARGRDCRAQRRRPHGDCCARWSATSSQQHPGSARRATESAYTARGPLMRSAADARRSTWTRSRPPCAIAYGRNLFGQGCLLARRLVERGVPFVEVTLGGVNGESDRHRLGHAPAELRRRQQPERRARPGLGDADGRPEAARPARLDADRLDGRVRPHAEDQRGQRAAITAPTPGPPSWPAAASRAARSSARPAPTA